VIELRAAALDDVSSLARMNRELIQDEGSRNPLTVEGLEARLGGWLTEKTYQVVLFLVDGDLAGYCVFQLRPDEYKPGQQSVYLRQFFIQRAYRRQGVGQAAFDQLARDWFPANAWVTLEVLSTNPGGQQFWEAVGFQPYCTVMELRLSPPPSPDRP
jgi:GNAT superfamily N-acetyltransferase